MSLVANKKALVFGVANDHSIAWAIAQALHREGAELAFTYVGESIERRVRPLAESLGVHTVLPCDVSKDEDIAATFAAIQDRWGRVDILIHAVAFALREELRGRFIETSRAGFHLALDVSTYSLVALARAAEPLMSSGGSVLTLSYFGAERVVPNYNVMGVAKAGLEASVRSRRDPSERSPPQASAASKTCSTITKPGHHCGAACAPRRWLGPRCTCAATWAAPLPARSYTSTVATMWSECERVKVWERARVEAWERE
jgi:NADP-dependent 3-hydroxy acid dehydrogenase YdfG